MALFSFKTIRSKLIFSGAVISTLIIILFYTSYRFTHHIKGEATRINLTGSLRYRIFEMTWLSERVAEREIAIDRGLRESAKAALKDEIAGFDEIISYVRHGNEEFKMKPLGHHSEEILSQFNRLMDEWDKDFKPVFLRIAELPEDVTEDEAREILSPVNSRVHEYVYEINNITQFLTEHSRKEIDKYDRLRFYVLAVFLLSAALIIFFVSRSVLSPLSRLKNVTEKFGEGRFDARADVTGTDEIGMLAGSFNKMAESINIAFKNLSERNRELDVINKISSVIGKSLSVEEIANAALNEILNLENLRIEKKGAIFVADNKSKVLNLTAHRGFSEVFAKAEAVVPFGDCLCGIVAETCREIVSGDCFTDDRHTRKYPEMTEHGHINLPLKSRDKAIGVLSLYLPARIKLTDEEISLCRSIADIIAISLQNAINHRQVTMLAQSLESSIDLITITDTGGRIIHANPQVVKHLGYAQDEMIGMDVSIIQSPKNPKGLGKEIYEKTLEGGWEGEVINIRKDGSEYPVLLTTSPVKDENGDIISLIGIARDITERKKLEEKLREYTEDLEKKVSERTSELESARLQSEAANQAKSDFLANMSHELRTPLNSIIGFSEIMKDGMTGALADNQKEYCNDIWESGRHLLRLINDILDLSKVEAGKVKLELSECNVAETIRACLLFFKEKSMRHSIKLSAAVSEDANVITADEQKVKQIILNLLGNAFKFTQDGGSISVKARLIPDFVEIAVEDTGIGIAPEDIEKLFQPFQQVEHHLTKQYEGTGLGLSLCKQFVELHGGRIWIESEVKKGSRFVFVLPINPSTGSG